MVRGMSRGLIVAAVGLMMLGTPASAEAESDFVPVPCCGDWAYWMFWISHTDPNTRLTRIDVTDLPLRWIGFGMDELVSYFFGFTFPEPVPGSIETPDGYVAPSYGWTFAAATETSFSLVHQAGFQGTVELYAFDGPAFTHDLYPTLRAQLDQGTVSFTTVTPEPLSMILLGTGLAGIAALRRRREGRLPGDIRR